MHNTADSPGGSPMQFRSNAKPKLPQVQQKVPKFYVQYEAGGNCIEDAPRYDPPTTLHRKLSTASIWTPPL